MQQSSMISYAKLPTEVWLFVIEDVYDVAPLSVTCHFFNTLCRPKLFAAVKLDVALGKKLLKVLLGNDGEIAKHIKRIDCDWDGDDWNDDLSQSDDDADGEGNDTQDKDQKIKKSIYTIQEMNKMAKLLGSSELLESLKQALCSGHDLSSILVVLIHCLPNLDTIHFNELPSFHPPSHLDQFVGLLTSKAITPNIVSTFKEHPEDLWPIGLRNLRSIQCAYWDTEGGFHMDQFQSILLVPKLETMSCHMAISGEAAFCNWVHLYGKELVLSDISFTYSTLSTGFLVDLISSCARIKRFSYEFNTSEYVDLEEFDARGIIDALREKHRSHLEVLELADISGYDWWEDEGERSVTGSLVEFTALQKLSIDRDLVSVPTDNDKVVEYFPASLKKLDIQVQGMFPLNDILPAHWTAKVYSLLRGKEASLPELQEVRVNGKLVE